MAEPSPGLNLRQPTTPTETASTVPNRPLCEDVQEQPEARFRFLDLPLELRLKIYSYILPPRHHKIALQTQNSPFFCNTLSSNLPATYPFGRRSPSGSGTTTPTGARSPPQGNLGTPSYKILTQNFRVAYPQPSIFPEILRTCRAIKSEAEGVLYGAREAVFDFGTSVDVVEKFWSERSQEARACVREVRVARGVKCFQAGEGGKSVDSIFDERWGQACWYMKTQLGNLRSLEVKFWSENGPENGSEDAYPVLLEEAAVVGEVHGNRAALLRPIPEDVDYEVVREKRRTVEKKFREWPWTQELLGMESLRKVKMTWWTFPGAERSFTINPWVPARTVSDSLVRDRLVREGTVVEAIVDLRFEKEEFV